MPSQRLLAGLVAVLAAALLLLSALFLSRERDRASPSASLTPARPVIAEVEPPSAEPLRVVTPDEGEELARTGRIELLPFDADHPETVAAPPLSDPARTWDQERDARRELASRSIALLLRDGTTPTTSAPGRAAPVPSGGGGGRVLIARAPPALETPRVPEGTIAPGRSGWMPGPAKVGPAPGPAKVGPAPGPAKVGPAPVPRRSAPAGRSGGSSRCTCP